MMYSCSPASGASTATLKSRKKGSLKIDIHCHYLNRDVAAKVAHLNPATVAGLMCRSLISVGWDGALHDCDFNQMLELPLGAARTIFELESLALAGQPIATGPHCFACTAGSGSSCGGSLA